MGVAAGFGLGLFQTPLAATFFALEVLVVGALFYEAMLPAMSAAFTASFTSHLLGLEKFSVSFSDTFSVNPQTIAKLILIAIVFGITGGAFSYFLAFAKEKLAKFIKNPYRRIFFTGIILSILFLLLWKGRYCGLGTNLISASFAGEKVYVFDFLLKAVFTIVTLAAGFQGGEVHPAFLNRCDTWGSFWLLLWVACFIGGRTRLRSRFWKCDKYPDCANFNWS